jgi:hypothetical protein
MNQSFLARIQILYNALKNAACDINQLQEVYLNNQIVVLRRQIYRDLEYLENDFLTKEERLIKNYLNNRKCEWFIQKANPVATIDGDYWYLFNLLKGFAPNVERHTTLDELFVEVQQYLINQYDNALGTLSRINIADANNINNTHFNAKQILASDFTLFKELHWCIVNQKRIKVKELDLDISRNNTKELPFYFSPVNFIIHQGNLYVGGLFTNNKALVLGMHEIVSYEIVQSKIKGKIDVRQHFEEEMKKRFGITENIDDKLYDIELDFEPHIGQRIAQMNLHSSQRFRKKGNVIRMEIRCGINRELMAWIFSWMYQVKIIAPQKLKEIHKYCFNKMKDDGNSIHNFSLFEDIFYK